MDQPPARTSLKGLKALVGVLGVMVVLGTALVVGVIIHRLYATPAPPSNLGGTPAAAVVPAVVAAALPAGSRILGLAAAGDKIAVWVTGAAGDAVWLIDPRTGTCSKVLTAPR